MGELFNNPHEWTPLITGRLIDYIRIHVADRRSHARSQSGGHWRKIHGVKTAWHGPGDALAHRACRNVTLDLTCPNFGIQEYSPFTIACRKCFGMSGHKERLLYANEAPGWGIEVNEKRGREISVWKLRKRRAQRTERRLGGSPPPGRQ